MRTTMHLSELLAQWRTAPNVSLADEIVAFAAPPEVPLEWASTVDERHVGVLLQALLNQGAKHGRARLWAVAQWPTDPRIDRWVAGLYLEPPITSASSRLFWAAVLPLAERIRDARAAETLRRARTALTGKKVWQRHLAKQVDRAWSALLKAGVVIAPALEQHGPATPASSGLLADVLRYPHDDQRRLVLADALLEQGDVRGELISLQFEALKRPLTGAETKRVAAIIKTSRAQLLGPLAEVLKAGAGFTKGFVSRAALAQTNSNRLKIARQTVAGHPLWATVEHLEGPGDADIAAHSVMRSIRSLKNTQVGLSTLAKLPTLEVLIAPSTDGSAFDFKPLLASGTFPSLTELRLTMGDWASMLASPLASRLSRLSLRREVSRYYAPTSLDEVFGALSLMKSTPCACPDITLEFMRYDARTSGSSFRFLRRAGSLSIEGLVRSALIDHDAAVVDDLSHALRYASALRPARFDFLVDLWSTEQIARAGTALRTAGATIKLV